MADSGKIVIKKQNERIESGRRKTEELKHYECWCEISDLYTNEQYAALQIKLENTVVFTVRKCKKINEILHKQKDFCVIYEGGVYDIYATASAKEETKVRLKCNRRS